MEMADGRAEALGQLKMIMEMETVRPVVKTGLNVDGCQEGASNFELAFHVAVLSLLLISIIVQNE
jgi:hypothetical protein